MPNNQAANSQPQNTTERALFKVVRFLLPLLVLCSVAFSTMVMIAMQPASKGNDVWADHLVHISPGMYARDVAELLASEGIVRDQYLFTLMLRLTRTDSQLQAGYYLLNPTMDAIEVIEQIRKGRSVTTQVTIPEGFELRQIASLLASHDLVDQERFLTLAQDASLVYGETLPLQLPIATLEGYLFPDTYRFVKGQSEEEIIRQMVARFLQVVPGAVEEQLADNDFTLHELVTLASIVEREIMVDRERAKVAAVYLNRLAINMPLQADPTVRYVMTEDRSRVLYRDLEIESPYNTYRNRGLPPGPIASPGLASILAVLNPAEVDYLFFVSRRDGTHVFTRTFNEHVRARRELGY